MQPDKPLSSEFVNDCVVWSLYASSNNTVSLRDVEYAGDVYQMPNHFFPMTLARLRRWSHADQDIALQLPTAEDRYVARWLAERALSADAEAVIAAGEIVFRLFYEQANLLRLDKFRIAAWDAGWWQVRSALADRDFGGEALANLKAAHQALRAKLAPAVEEFGFFR